MSEQKFELKNIFLAQVESIQEPALVPLMTYHSVWVYQYRPDTAHSSPE